MTKETAKKIRLLYGLVLSALLVCTGVCLIVACLSIYQSGDAPFTRESIGAWFSKIAVPVWLTVAAIVGGGVLSLVLPSDEPRLRGIRDGRAQLRKLETRVDFAKCDASCAEGCRREQKYRRVLLIAVILLFAVSAVPLVLHLFSPNSFTPDLNESVIKTTVMSLPFLFVTGVGLWGYYFLGAKSIERETALLKSAMAAGALRKPEAEQDKSGKNSARATLGLRLALLGAAILLIVLGIFNGGMRDTLGKAIKICTECIGLG